MAMPEVDESLEDIGMHYVIRLRCLLIDTAETCAKAEVNSRDVWMMLTDGLFAELLSASEATHMNEAAFMMMCRQAWQAWRMKCTEEETRH